MTGIFSFCRRRYGAGEICSKASSRPVEKLSKSCPAPRPRGPTAPGKAGPVWAWVLVSVWGRAPRSHMRGFWVSLSTSYNQLAKGETETKSTQLCQPTETTRCLNGVVSPLTWSCPRQLHSDLATYFKLRWSGRKWKGKKGKSGGKADKVLRVAEGQRWYGRRNPGKGRVRVIR